MLSLPFASSGKWEMQGFGQEIVFVGPPDSTRLAVHNPVLIDQESSSAIVVGNVPWGQTCGPRSASPDGDPRNFDSVGPVISNTS